MFSDSVRVSCDLYRINAKRPSDRQVNFSNWSGSVTLKTRLNPPSILVFRTQILGLLQNFFAEWRHGCPAPFNISGAVIGVTMAQYPMLLQSEFVGFAVFPGPWSSSYLTAGVHNKVSDRHTQFGKLRPIFPV